MGHDGRIVAAERQEGFTRAKRGVSFPRNAVAYRLREGGLAAKDLNHVLFHEKPPLKFERLLETHVASAPSGFRAFLRATPIWLHKKLNLPREMSKGLDGGCRRSLCSLCSPDTL